MEEEVTNNGDFEDIEDINITTTTENGKTIYKAKMQDKYIDMMEQLPNQSFILSFEDYEFIVKELFKDEANERAIFMDKLYRFSKGEEISLYTDKEYDGMALTLLNDKLKTIFRKIQASYIKKINEIQSKNSLNFRA